MEVGHRLRLCGREEAVSVLLIDRWCLHGMASEAAAVHLPQPLHIVAAVHTVGVAVHIDVARLGSWR